MRITNYFQTKFEKIPYIRLGGDTDLRSFLSYLEALSEYESNMKKKETLREEK